MKCSKTLGTIILALATSAAMAAPITAPYSRTSLFLDSENPGWKDAYTSVNTTALGTVKYLKYTATMSKQLTDVLDMSNKYAGYKTWNKVSYQQISEKGQTPQETTDYLGQCVGFGKAMTGIGATKNWIKSSSNALSTLYPGGKIGTISPELILPSGTFLVNFDGRPTYTNWPSNHVAISLAPVIVNGVIQGANVVAQNATATNSSDLMISKYFLPWDNKNSTLSSYSLKNYHLLTK